MILFSRYFSGNKNFIPHIFWMIPHIIQNNGNWSGHSKSLCSCRWVPRGCHKREGRGHVHLQSSSQWTGPAGRLVILKLYLQVLHKTIPLHRMLSLQKRRHTRLGGFRGIQSPHCELKAPVPRPAKTLRYEQQRRIKSVPPFISLCTLIHSWVCPFIRRSAR